MCGTACWGWGWGRLRFNTTHPRCSVCMCVYIITDGLICKIRLEDINKEAMGYGPSQVKVTCDGSIYTSNNDNFC